MDKTVQADYRFARQWIVASVPEAERTRSRLYKYARQLLKDKKLNDGYSCLLRVAWSCICMGKGQRLPCACKKWNEAAVKPVPGLFIEAMWACRCSVGNKYQKCDDTEHIRALNDMIPLLLNKGDIAKAKYFARWLIELAPRCMEGYLRYAQVLRKSSPTQHETVLGVYRNAMHVGSENGQGGLCIYKALTQTLVEYENMLRIKLKGPGVDLIHKFPNELMDRILEGLSQQETLNLMRCSKAWYQWITSSPHLWRVMIVRRARLESKSAVTLKGISRLPLLEVRSLVLAGQSVPLGKATAMLLNRLAPNLTHLHLEYGHNPDHSAEHIIEPVAALMTRSFNLQYLSLRGLSLHPKPRLSQNLLDKWPPQAVTSSSGSTLKHLSVELNPYEPLRLPEKLLNLESAIVSVAPVTKDKVRPNWDLSKLRRSSSRKVLSFTTTLVNRAPKLKHLWMEYFDPNMNVREGPPEPLDPSGLDILVFGHSHESVIIRPSVSIDSQAYSEIAQWLHKLSDIKIFHTSPILFNQYQPTFLTRSSPLAMMAMHVANNPDTNPNAAQYLTEVRSIGPLCPTLLTTKPQSPLIQGLMHSMNMGNLQHVSIMVNVSDSVSSLSYFEQTPLWGLSSIKTLTFNLSQSVVSHSAFSFSEPDPGLSPFLKSLPNLTAILIYDPWPEDHQLIDVGRFISAILSTEHPMLTHVYQDVVAHIDMKASLQKCAEMNGKKLCRPRTLAGQPGQPVTERTVKVAFKEGFPVHLSNDYPPVPF